MNNEQLFDTAELAIEAAAKEAPKTVRVASVCDFANQNNEGFDADGRTTFRIYRTFDKKMKQKYQVRLCYVE